MSKPRSVIGPSSVVGVMLALMLGPVGCCPNAHQIAQAPPPQPEPCPANAAPPPPPPPKCESLAERCEANEQTRVAIGDNAASFQPPLGWNYAKESGDSVTHSADGKAWLAFAEVDSSEQKQLLKAVQRLAERLEVDKIRIDLLKNRLRTPQHEIDARGVAIKLWEIDKKSQFGTEPVLNGSEPGTMLLAVVPLETARVVVGTGFVTTPAADTHAKSVMKSVQSLKPLGVTEAKPASDPPPSPPSGQ